MTRGIVTGSFEALERRLLEDVAALQRGDPLRPVPVLVGSNLLKSYLRFRLARSGRAVANVRLFTFLDLVTRLWRDAGAEFPPLPRLGPSCIVSALLERDLPEVFRDVGDLAGFRAAVLDTVRDLGDAGLTPADLDAALAQVGRERRASLKALADLFRGFRARAAAFTGIDDRFRGASDAALRAATLGGGILLVYGLYDVTGQQGDLLEALAREIELRCYVPFIDRERSSFARRFLEARARDLGLAPEPLVAPGAPSSRRDLAERLFAEAPDGPALEPDGTFVLLSVPGDSRGAVEIVREILSAARDGVITGFHEAAVVFGHPDEDAPALIEALRLRGIPYYLHGGEPLSRRPLGRAVLDVASLEPSGFPRAGILRVMERVAAARAPGAAADWDPAAWRRSTNDPAFLAGVEAWDAGIEALGRRPRTAACDRGRAAASAEEERGDDAATAVAAAELRLASARGLKAAWRMLRDAAAGWPDELPWQGWAALLLERLGPILGGTPDWPSFLAAAGDLAELGRVESQGGASDGAVARARMTDLLREALDAAVCPDGRFLESGVNILSVTAARGLRFPLVIVPGLDEGRFPAKLRQDPLLLDVERRKVGSGARLALKSARGAEERLLFDMLVRSAAQRLVLVTSRLDESSDRERIPSVFFLRAARAARGRPTGYAELTETSVPGFREVALDSIAPPEGVVALDDGEVRLRLVARDPARALETLGREEPDRFAGPIALERSRRERSLTPFDGSIRDTTLRRWVAGRVGAGSGPVSAGGLEVYLRCPYRFYLERVHRLAAWEETESPLGMEPLERGKVVHAILEAFVAGLEDARLDTRPAGELHDRLATLARQLLERSRPTGIPDLLWEIERDRLLTVLSRWLDLEIGRQAADGLLPVALELAFAPLPGPGCESGFTIRAGRHTFAFRGRIDRVDLSEDRRRGRVIDYKSGKLPPAMVRADATPLMAGERLQLAVYRGALRSIPDYARTESVQGEYLHLDARAGSAVARAFDADALEAAERLLPAILERVGDGIEEGAFFARPRGRVYSDNCGICDYVPICGKDRDTRARVKSGDPAVVRFRAIGALDGWGADE